MMEGQGTIYTCHLLLTYLSADDCLTSRSHELEAGRSTLDKGPIAVSVQTFYSSLLLSIGGGACAGGAQ